MNSCWLNVDLHVINATVDVHNDPEEDIRKIVVTYNADADADEALELWDQIGQDLDQWAASCSGCEAAEVLDVVITNVHWRE
jgi:hypothetical protein